MSHSHSHDHSHDHGHEHAPDPGHSHDHGHPHDHAHGPAHDHAQGHQHHHGDDDPYYLDQLCQIALTATFGGICLILYFFHSGQDASGKDAMLRRMLSERFFPYVLAGGIALLVIALVRAYCLWHQSKGAVASAHPHGHDHHGHEHHDHEHDVAEEMRANQAVPSPHGHGHDHEHGWAPWRYVVLMVPVILFVLGQPSRAHKGSFPTLSDVEETPVKPPQAAALATLNLAGAPYSSLVFVGAILAEERTGPPVVVTFKELHDSASSESERRRLQDKIVLVKGQYLPDPRDEKVGVVMRFLRQCCSADAFQLTVYVVGRQPLPQKFHDWVQIRGRAHYFERGGRHYLQIVVLKAEDIDTTVRQDESIYIDK